MERQPVSSSSIRSIGYDPATETLEVEFSKGVYAYHGVSPEKHRALMEADSIGKHHATHIKSHHDFTRIK